MLELERNVIFGQFIDTGSVVHRLDPRFKILATAVLVVGTFVVNSLSGYAVFFLLLAAIQLVTQMPLGYLLRGMRIFLIFLVFILAFEILFYPSAVPESHVLWRWWILSVSTDALHFAAIIALRVIFLFYITTMIMLVTPLVDLTDGMELLLRPLQRLRVPVNELTLVAVIAIKFVPIFIAEAERLGRAQSARGVPFDQGGALVRARRMGRLLVPIFLSGFRRADELTMAMDTRCYQGGRNRTKYRRFTSTSLDWLALAVTIVWVVAAWQLPERLGWPG